MRPPIAKAGLIVEQLAGQHGRLEFRCGIASLDRYLREQATQDLRRRVAIPYVLTDGGTIIGYYTLSSSSIEIADFPATVLKELRLPRYPLAPAILLGRLAVSQQHQGHRLGEHLLMDALRRSLQSSRSVAAMAVIVDAESERAKEFYSLYQFVPLIDQPLRLFLPMRTIADIFNAPKRPRSISVVCDTAT